MNRLKPHRDFEPSGYSLCERDRPGAYRIRVRLDGDTSERGGQFRDPQKVSWWNRSLVEEIARVVKLESLWYHAGKRFQSALQLTDQRTRCRWTVRGPSPQVAERTRERTLGTREKDCKRPLDLSVGAALVLDQSAVGPIRIYLRLGRAETPNPPIGCRGTHTTAACRVSKCRR